MTKELHSGSLYWPATLTDVPSYLPLRADGKAETVIIGGGMSGVVCGYVLAKSGMPAILLEQGKITGGSTSANTGLLQFSNDIMLSDLIGQIGESAAVAFYRACKEAIEQLVHMVQALPVDASFKRRSSLYYASSEQDVPKLTREWDALRRYGFDAELWDAGDIAKRFPFVKPKAIVTHGDAEINPYRFIHGIAQAGTEAGLVIHEQTKMVSCTIDAGGGYTIRTDNGFEIKARNIVIAVGYEPEQLRGKLLKANLNRTFVAVTEPQKDLSAWHERFLLWETARPYLYLRTTPDDRVLIGGLDEEEPQPVQGNLARRRRTEKLHGLIRTFFPALDAPLAYEWCGTFGESRDNLPFIGEDPLRKRIYYCLGYGGNGSVYSILGAHLLRDLILGCDNPIARIVGFERAALADV